MGPTRGIDETEVVLDEDRVALVDRTMVYRCLNDSEWTMLWVSPGCELVTGYPPSDLVANRRVTYGALILPDDRLEVSIEVQGALEENRPFQISYRIARSDGRVTTVWEQGHGVRGLSGRVEYLEGVIAAADGGAG